MLSCFWYWYYCIWSANSYVRFALYIGLFSLIKFAKNFSSFNNKENRGFIEKDSPLETFLIIEKEPNGIDIDDIENLEDSPRFGFINEECLNLKVANDGGEFTININQMKMPDVWQAVLSVTKFFRGEYFFNKHAEYC